MAGRRRGGAPLAWWLKGPPRPVDGDGAGGPVCIHPDATRPRWGRLWAGSGAYPPSLASATIAIPRAFGVPGAAATSLGARQGAVHTRCRRQQRHAAAREAPRPQVKPRGERVDTHPRFSPALFLMAPHPQGPDGGAAQGQVAEPSQVPAHRAGGAEDVQAQGQGALVAQVPKPAAGRHQQRRGAPRAVGWLAGVGGNRGAGHPNPSRASPPNLLLLLVLPHRHTGWWLRVAELWSRQPAWREATTITATTPWPPTNQHALGARDRAAAATATAVAAETGNAPAPHPLVPTH